MTLGATRRIVPWATSLAIALCLCCQSNRRAATSSDRLETAWPFSDWKVAQSYTFNFVPYGPGHQLTLYDPERGWNERIRSRKELDQTTAAEVAATIARMKGTAATSRCPFPRHGIAFFGEDRTTPLGVVSVCFTCEDIFVWPDYQMTLEERYAWDDETGDLARGPAIAGAFDYFEGLFRELGEPVWDDQQAAKAYFQRSGRRTPGRRPPSPGIACDPLPREGAPCASGVCAIPGDAHSYFQCTDGRWVRITEQTLEQ